MDDSFGGYRAATDANGRTLILSRGNDRNWRARFTFQREGPDQLVLDGAMDGHQIHMQLELLYRNKFLLISRGYHWIQEYSFNR